MTFTTLKTRLDKNSENKIGLVREKIHTGEYHKTDGAANEQLCYWYYMYINLHQLLWLYIHVLMTCFTNLHASTINGKVDSGYVKAVDKTPAHEYLYAYM